MHTGHKKPPDQPRRRHGSIRFGSIHDHWCIRSDSEALNGNNEAIEGKKIPILGTGIERVVLGDIRPGLKVGRVDLDGSREVPPDW